MKRLSAEEQRLLTTWLVAFDESLAEGPTSSRPAANVPGELSSQLDEAIACVELLHRVRRQEGGDGPWEAPGALPPSPSNRKRIGRFRILRELGRGGLGVVFLAHDPELGRDVALKIPRADVLSTDDSRRRFQREAEATARLGHPNLLTLYEVCSHEGQLFLVSEFCAGPTLAQWLAERGSRVSPSEAAQLIAPLAEGIEHAHARGVLHRDIKPSNILLSRSASEDGAAPPGWVPRLTDFGMAKLMESAGRDETRTGALIGTPAYMAPEQVDSRHGKPDPRTDIYALGAILYELLCGRPPFRGDSDVDTLRQLIVHEPSTPRSLNRDVPRDLEAICLKCLARNRADRYPSALALADDLRRFQSGQPTQARPLGPLGRIGKWVRRRPTMAALLAVSTVSIGAILGGSLFYNVRLSETAARANTAQSIAEREAEQARRLLYSADVRLAFEALSANDVPQALALLDRQRPQSGKPDLREFAWRLLRSQCSSEELTLRGHTGPIRSIVYAPDGSTLATASEDHTTRLWDAASGRQRQTLRGHSDEVYCVAFAPSGEALATGGADRSIRVWDLPRGEARHVLGGHTDAVMSVAFSKLGSHLASGSNDGTVRVWDVSTGQLVTSLSAAEAGVRGVAFIDADQLLVAADESGALHAWRTSDWSEQSTDRFDAEKFFILAVDSSASRVAAAGRREVVRTWRHTPDGLRRDGNLNFGHRGWIQALAFSPVDRDLASAGKDAVIRIWDTDRRSIRRTLLGHTARVWSIAWSPDGRRLASSSDDKTARVWSLADEEAANIEAANIVDTPDEIFDLQVAPRSGRLIGIGHGDLKTWDLKLRDEPNQVTLSDAYLDVLRLSPDESLVALRDAEGETQIRRCDTWELVSRAPSSGQSLALAWLPRSRQLATTIEESEVVILNADTGQVERRFAHPTKVKQVLFTPNGERMAVVTHDGLFVWDLAHHKVEFSVPTSFGDRVARCGNEGVWLPHDNQASYISFAQRKVTSTLAAAGGRATSLELSHDGATLALATKEPSQLSLWDARTGQELMRIDCNLHEHSVLRFSPDGATLYAVGIGFDKPTRILRWEAPPLAQEDR